jgi:hypothetical protein
MYPGTFLQIHDMEFCFFFKSMTWNFVFSSNSCTRVHGMEFWFFFKSMYPGTWIWEKILIMRGRGGGSVPILFWNLTHFFDIQFKNTFNLIFPRFQGVIWKMFSQEIQNRSYFWEYEVSRFSKLSPKLSTYRSDTLYKVKNSEIWAPAFFKHNNSILATVTAYNPPRTDC